MSAGILQLCRPSVRNTRVLKLKPTFSCGQAKSITTAPSIRRAITKRTHFLNLPLYEGPDVYSKMAELRQLWRQGAESAQLEPGIIIPSIKVALSIKLGNVNIKGNEATTITYSAHSNSPPSQEEPPAFERDEVVKVMEELKGPICQLLASHGVNDVLEVPLGGLVPLMHGRHENFNPHKVNVLFLQPAAGKGFDITNAISELVHEKFTAAGMLAGAPTRAANINATLINTANRQGYVPVPGKPRKSFNLTNLYNIEGFNAFRPDSTESLPEHLGTPVRVNLGVAEVRSLQLVRVLPGIPNDDVKPECEAEVTFAT